MYTFCDWALGYGERPYKCKLCDGDPRHGCNLNIIWIYIQEKIHIIAGFLTEVIQISFMFLKRLIYVANSVEILRVTWKCTREKNLIYVTCCVNYSRETFYV